MRIEDFMKTVPEAENPYNVTQSLHQKIQEGLMSRGGRRDRRTIDQTKALIKEFIRAQKRPCLILEICEYLDRKPTPHFRGILSEMVRVGDLVQDHDVGPGAVMPRFWYSLPTM